VRTARVLKGARNAAVVAEALREAPLATSGHPFASGLHLPAAMDRILAYSPLQVPPVRVDGAALPVELLPPSCLDADLPLPRRKPGRSAKTAGGLDMVSFADFDSCAWAAGPVPGVTPDSDVPLVLLPWNLDHPGSIVPEVLARLSSLQSPRRPRVRIMVLPFNYLGQTGIIRRLTALRALSRTILVEVGDPEHDWTMARLRAAGFAPRALAGGEERVWVESETRYGTLAYHTAIPSLRELRGLLDETTALPP
jgi:hypothetical protein